jgi:hypothetical protein
MCVTTCQVTNGDAFFITTVPPGVADVALVGAAQFASTFSAVGTTFLDASGANPVTGAVCLYDFLLIAGGRDANGVEADRYCGNALNPAPIPTAFAVANALVPAPANPLTANVPGGSTASVQVCSKLFVKLK